jgi:hypothetical protein
MSLTLPCQMCGRSFDERLRALTARPCSRAWMSRPGEAQSRQSRDGRVEIRNEVIDLDLGVRLDHGQCSRSTTTGRGGLRPGLLSAECGEATPIET